MMLEQRKWNALRRLLGVVLALMLATAGLPLAAWAADIQTGIPAIEKNKTIIGFGGKEWYVIGYGGTGVNSVTDGATLLLRTGQAGTGTAPYQSIFGNNNKYQGSTLQTAMGNVANDLVPREVGLIIPRTLTSDDGGMAGNTAENQSFWPLSRAEKSVFMNSVVIPYSVDWWLRTPTDQSPYTVWASQAVGTETHIAISTQKAVRPAFTLNLASILFTSAASGGKSTEVGSSLSAAEPLTNYMKFTMVDSTLALSVTSTAPLIKAPGQSIGVAYEGATTGANHYVSCVIEDSSGVVQYYGKLATATAGDATIALPFDMPYGEYKLRLFCEQDNGNNYTDFASDPVSIALTVTEPEETPDVDIDFEHEKLTGFDATGSYTINGDGVTPDDQGEISIDSTWFGTILSIVKKGDGTIIAESFAQNLTIPARPDAPMVTAIQPAVIGGTGDIDGTTEAMEYSNDEIEWEDCTEDGTIGLVPGTYYVRIKQSGDAFAGTPMEIVISAFVPTAESKPVASIDYVNVQLIDLVANSNYMVDDSAEISNESGKLDIDPTWLGTTLSIVKKGDDLTTVDSEAQTMYIPARPGAPNVTVIQPAAIEGKGSLRGTTTAMEYSNDEIEWEDCTEGSTTGLAPGTYYVRMKLTISAFSGVSIQIEIFEYEPNAEETPEVDIDYAYEQLSGLVPSADYTIDGNAFQADVEGKYGIAESWMDGEDHKIVKRGNGTTTIDSDPKTLFIPARPGTPKVKAIRPTVIDGVGGISGTTRAMEYSADKIVWTDCMKGSTTGLAAGTYYVRKKPTSSAFAGVPIEIVISAYVPKKEATPAARIDYANEKLTKFVRTGSYTIDGDDVTLDAQKGLAIDPTWLGTTLSIVKKGDGMTTIDSEEQSLAIPARLDAPAVNAVNETFAWSKNGRITGVSTEMEYKLSTETSWITCPPTVVTALAPGDYQVRLKATGTDFASAVADVTIAAGPNPPIKRQPVVSGSIALSGAQGEVGAKTVNVQLTDANIGSGLEFTCAIGDVEAKATATANGALAFDFTANQLNALLQGSHDIMVSSEGNAVNHFVEKTKVGTLTVSAPAPTTWTVPARFTAMKGRSYQLVQTLPEGRVLPKLTYKLGNKKAKIDENGVLTAVSAGSVKLTVTDASGATKTCKIKVVANSFTRKKPLMIKGKNGLYTSTKRLYYKGSKLYAEVFVYNRTGASITDANDFVFELRDGNTLIYGKPIPSWPFKAALKHKQHKVYKLTITDAMLPGVSQKSFDLGLSGVQALITGTDASGNPCVPLTAGMANVVKPKGEEAEPSVEEEEETLGGAAPETPAQGTIAP